MGYFPIDRIVRKREVRTARHTASLPLSAATDIIVPFATAFDDTDYTIVRDFEAASTVPAGAIEMQRIVSRQIDSVTVRMLNNSAAAVSVILHIIIIHD